MSWVLLSLGVYTFVYCVVLLFLGNFSGGVTLGMDKQVVGALIGAGVSVVTILGSIIKDRISEKGEHDALGNQIRSERSTLEHQIENKHIVLGDQIRSVHIMLKDQIQSEHNAFERQLTGAQARLNELHDESIEMKNFRKQVESQGINATTLKASIDALIQNNGENITRVRDLSQNLTKSEQALADTERKLYDCERELAQCQQENEQLKQQIYNLQHPQQSWDEPER